MGWFSNWSKDNDDDDDKRDDRHPSEEMFRSFMNFSSGGSSTSRTCKIDPEDNNFMICKVRETRTENVNGENVTNTYERDERVPSFVNGFPGGNLGRNSIEGFDENSANLPDIFNNGNRRDFPNQQHPFGNLFGDMNQPLNEIFREMERTFGAFHRPGPHDEHFFEHRGEPFLRPGFNQNSTRANNFSQNGQQQQSRHTNTTHPSQYNYSFKKSQKMDRDIADV